ncbi:TPA: ogr/Delta-like zinc finger family protein [Salmonella enterica subsp. enterica serovar Muenchen]|uniref:Transcriptional regulator n=1 Tax=Salmonella enterica TaxID=28901 RepID=A0A5T5VMK9_SALER|nr:transcriptional regulator [Salmonella enterica]ECS8541078.1 transcriptional regulator [Salmonella enterica subsp. enterica serovar Oslo]EDX6462372.1 transcriptional regulator [Salmonella enterica subsp. diarizonae serovar 60:r:e,n,x,z15]ECI9604713.1 transcriptional regulator [Salmonella enterica]ECR9393215.1 transcriptional regulator [Salmonella enterica]
MFKCPVCGSNSHTRTSEYLSKNVKKSYYNCINVDCMCAYTTLEFYDRKLTKRIVTNDDNFNQTENEGDKDGKVIYEE